jgi:signal transduction histidine kinase
MQGGIQNPQQEIELLKRQLLQAQRMAALGELVGTTTHEFNNVLMTILNYAKLGLRHKDESTRDKALEKILAAAQRAEKITNSVLGLARNRKEEFAPTHLDQLINESLILLERELQKYRVQVRCEFAEIPPVRAIGNQIQQVLLNMMTNARQAMPNGGELLLRLAHDHASNTVELTIRDTGSGIPQESLTKIFDRYYSTKSGPDETGKGGTGVGLATCKEIIDAHQGRIRVESSLGRGTAFIIRLPVSQPTAAPIVPIQKLGIPGMTNVPALPH